MDAYLSGLVINSIGFGLLFVYVGFALARVERQGNDTKDELRIVRKLYWDLYMESHAAFRTLDLTKTPRKDPEWIKKE